MISPEAGRQRKEEAVSVTWEVAELIKGDRIGRSVHFETIGDRSVEAACGQTEAVAPVEIKHWADLRGQSII